MSDRLPTDELTAGNEIEGITLVTDAAAEKLNPRQQIDYANHRKDFVEWLCFLGKNPKKAEGYAHDTAYRRANDIDRFYRFWWDEQGSYTTRVPTEAADQFLHDIATSSYSNSHKANMLKSLKCYWRWREVEWDPEFTFSSYDGPEKPQDYLKREERRKLREAALEFGSVPSPDNLSEEEFEEWANILAQRFRIPAEKVGPAEFERANGFKYVSMLSTSLDAGLRPKEVERARTSWIDLNNGLLRIPASQSTKNRENWEVPLRDDTVQYLDLWLEERQRYEKYEGTDNLWLTRHGNPYGTDALRHVMKRLCKEAGIWADNRQLTWYAIRHSTGTYMVAENGLQSAAAQLRHKSTATTEKYDHAPVEERRDALEDL